MTSATNCAIGFTLAILTGCSSGSGDAAPPGPDPRDAAFARSIQDLLDAELTTLGGAPTPPAYACATPGRTLGEDPRQRTSSRPMGAGSTLMPLATNIWISAFVPGQDNAGLSIHLIMRPDGGVTWLSVGPEVMVPGERRALDPAWIVAHAPALNGILARTVEGLSSCTLPRASAADVAVIAEEGRAGLVSEYERPMQCAEMAARGARALQIDSVAVHSVLQNGTSRVSVHSAIAQFGSGGQDFNSCFVVTDVDS